MTAHQGCIILCLIAGFVQTAWAADPTVTAADTSVRLGMLAGYGEADTPEAAGGALFGGEAGISALTSSGFGGYGLPDLYTDANYDFTAVFLPGHDNQQGALQDTYGNLAIVRLGLGRPVARGGEIIPYVAGGYQDWYRDAQSGGGNAYFQTGLIGGGLKFDLPASQMLVLSASAEGLAMIGGSVSAPSQDFSGSVGTGAEERVGLDADYRLNQSWHAYAGLGVTHYNYAGPKYDSADGNFPSGAALQVNSMFGVAYGF
jgi:hypothetical protein